jgi:hypothetical protein
MRHHPDVEAQGHVEHPHQPFADGPSPLGRRGVELIDLGKNLETAPGRRDHTNHLADREMPEMIPQYGGAFVSTSGWARAAASGHWPVAG